MATTTTIKPPEPSALTSFISSSTSFSTATQSDSQYPPHLHALALNVLHNLQHQHDWRALTIHTTSSSPTSSLPLPRPLISGIPPRRVYTHPDMQLQLIKARLREEDVDPERIYIVPSVLREKWSLKTFSDVFAGVPTPWEEKTRESGEEGKRKWIGDDVKRVLLATVDEDSTVVYYVVHDGIVKPRQN